MLRLKKFILPAIIILMVSLLAGCTECSWIVKSDPAKYGQIGRSESIDTTAGTLINFETITDDTDGNLNNANKHGVLPTKVTWSNDVIGASGYHYQTLIEFWNVGKLGDEQYWGASMKMWSPDAPEDLQESWGDWGGFFTGGPNGDIYLTLIEGEGTHVSPKFHFKLKDGKELITDDGGIMKIDNPEAFDGWID